MTEAFNKRLSLAVGKMGFIIALERDTKKEGGRSGGGLGGHTGGSVGVCYQPAEPSGSQSHPTPLLHPGARRGAGMGCEHQNPAQPRGSWIKPQDHVPALLQDQRGN